MFDDIIQQLISNTEIKLNEVLSPEEIIQIKSELAVPEIRPCTFDVTIPGWLARIDTWGTISIYHKDPENFRGKKNVTQNFFLKRISVDALPKFLGTWHIEKVSLTSCKFVRDYVSYDGKKYKEEFIIEVQLKKPLNKIKQFFRKFI